MAFADQRHPAYDHFNAKEAMGKRNGTQAGEPAKGARAMYELAVLEDPPLRCCLGSDAVQVSKHCQYVYVFSTDPRKGHNEKARHLCGKYEEV